MLSCLVHNSKAQCTFIHFTRFDNLCVKIMIKTCFEHDEEMFDSYKTYAKTTYSRVTTISKRIIYLVID